MYVSVAVMDTGIFRHMDFDTRIAGFADFVGRKKYLYDDNGHGTHVAGIIAGSGKGSNGKYRGIAPDTFLVSVKVLDKSGNGKIENVVEAAGWIIENKSAMNIRVVNISSAAALSSSVICTKVLWLKSIVVSHNCSASISPRPLYLCMSALPGLSAISAMSFACSSSLYV